MKRDVKVFKTIDEQLDILKSRNVIIVDMEYSKQLLEDLNYYNLLANRNFLDYDNLNETFKNDIKIELLEKIYFYNFDLRNFIFKYISYIESSIKSKIAYEHSKKYGPLGYKDVNNFVLSAKDPNEKGKNKHEEIIYSLNKEIERSQEEYIVWHKNNYKDFPLWVAINKLSFGDMSKFYKLIIHSDKKSVSNYFNAGPNQIEKWLWQFSILRNVCAHQGNILLWNYQDIPLDSKYNGMFSCSTFYQYIIAMFHLLRCDGVMCNFIEDFTKLVEKYDGLLNNKLGIPSTYEDDLINININY